MNNHIYPRLAVTNLRKNGSTYFPYMLTCICSIITFYTMQSIAENPGLQSMPGGDSTQSMLGFGTAVIGIFSAVLLFYTNSFLIKRRKRELGLYSILGMEKKHIAMVLFYETLFTAGLSLILGLIGGMLISKLLFMLLLAILRFSTPIVFTVSVSALASTALLFAAIFLLTLLANFRQIHLSNPISLLRGGQKGEREPKVSWPLAVTGVLALGGGYAIALTVESPIDALLLFFLAVLLVILGTYCLFTAGSIALLKLLKRSKTFYYNPKNFISVSGMLYRMKQNAVGLANICILSTMVLVTVSTTVCLYVGQESILKERYPQDMTILTDGAQDNRAALESLVEETGSQYGVTPSGMLHYRAVRVMACLEGNRFLSEENEDYNSICDVTFLSLEDYNRLHGTNETLEPEEALVFVDYKSYGRDTAEIGGITYRVKKELDTLVLDRKKDSVIQKGYYFVVSSLDGLPEALESYSRYDRYPTVYVLSFNVEGEEEACFDFGSEITSLTTGEESYGARVSNVFLDKASWYADYGGFLFLGIFLGLMFMMATVLIIYYKQISEGYEDHDRFQIMQKVGMSKREVKKTIHKQILMVFFLPLLAAACHVAFAFRVISKLLLLFGLTNVGLFFLCTLVSLVVFGFIYALVYALTAKTYYRLVESRTGL